MQIRKKRKLKFTCVLSEEISIIILHYNKSYRGTSLSSIISLATFTVTKHSFQSSLNNSK